MSFYASIQGNVTYKNKADFDIALALIDGDKGWLNFDGQFIDENNDIMSGYQDEPDIDEENLTISIPYGLYRNLSRVLSDLMKNGSGTMVWTSTDGCFSGGVLTNNGLSDCKEESYDLQEWACNHDLAPSINVTSPQMNEDWNDVFDWQEEVQYAFHECFV